MHKIDLFKVKTADFWATYGLVKLFYSIKQIEFIFACCCTVIDHRRRHCLGKTKSTRLSPMLYFLFFASVTSSEIYYSTDAR